MSPEGPTWRQHLDQLRPRVISIEDTEPGDNPNSYNVISENSFLTSSLNQLNINSTSTDINPRLPTDCQFCCLHLRRSSRTRKLPVGYGSPVPS